MMNYYLEKLGLKESEMVSSFYNENDERVGIWDYQNEMYGFNETELWSLDTTFIQWLYSRVSMFLEKAPKSDLQRTIEWKKKELTIEQALKKIQKWSGYACLHQYDVDHEKSEKAYKKMIKASKLWTVVFPYLWY